MRRILIASAVVSGVVLAVGCAQHATSGPAPKSATGPNAGTTAANVGTPVTRPPHKPLPQFAERAPPLGISAPMKGDPSVAQLAESRLSSSTCDETLTDDVQPALREMRAAVDESFKDWVAGQPACWEAMRQEYRWRKEMEREAAAGGLGLSGVGEGGGGRGEGIGLGEVGTIGHGSGTGTGQGFGSASGNMWGGQHASSTEPKTAKKSSGTNNQVAGVDEADIVKTDGTWVYVVANGAFRILEALNPKVVATVKFTGTPRDMFVDGDRAVIYSSTGHTGKTCTYAYDCTFAGDGTSTRISVFDISNRAEPKVARSFDLSGSLIAARRIGNTVHTVVSDGDIDAPPYETWPADLDMCGTPEATVRSKFAKLRAQNETVLRTSHRAGYPTIRENGAEKQLCGVYKPPVRDGHAFTSLVSFDLTDDKTAPVTSTLESKPGAVFASDKALYISVVHQKTTRTSNRWYSYYPTTTEVSDIHKFRIGATPKETKYVGSGSVPGHVLNQFSMDEWYGYLRVATSKGRVPDPGVESMISIFSETSSGSTPSGITKSVLTRVGAIDKIAPGEDIRAVRFDGDRGYVVTFKKTDPLFVADLFSPTRPQILGELKIPGFSTYLHRIDPQHLMSIGFDADDQGSFAYFNGIILQLFDVADATHPKLLHKEKIGTRGSSSEAATNHLAFNWMPSEGLLALPMTICDGGGNGQFGTLAFSGLLVYDVDLERGFTRLGGVDHGTHGVDCNTWWSNANSSVKRSVFLDDLVYSIADDRAKVQRLDHFGTDVADLAFE